MYCIVGTALTQFFPILKVGYLFTYVVPLVFVLALSIGKEGYDDIKRMLQDKVIALMPTAHEMVALTVLLFFVG